MSQVSICLEGYKAQYEYLKNIKEEKIPKIRHEISANNLWKRLGHLKW